MDIVPIITAWPVLFALVSVNLAAFAIMALDKERTWYGRPRISKSAILMLSAMGGWLGTKIAQVTYRHMQLRQPFASNLNMIILSHFLAIALLAFVTSDNAMSWLEEHRETLTEENQPTEPRRFGPTN